MKYFISLLLFVSVSAFASFLPTDSRHPGGVAVINLPPNTISASFQGKQVALVDAVDHKTAVVGLDIKLTPGKHTLSYQTTDRQSKTHQHDFTLTKKAYPKEHITIKNKRKVNPNKTDVKRITKESVKLKKALVYRSDKALESLKLTLPVKGRFSSPFGYQRIFNGQPRNPHSGLDIAAPTGTPIKAPKAGKVILTGNYFFNGNTVFLDHGDGFVTFYCHMNRIDVKEGETVKIGDVLGTVGSTGRVTGPHLHWSVVLNGSKVDPKLFLDGNTAG